MAAVEEYTATVKTILPPGVRPTGPRPLAEAPAPGRMANLTGVRAPGLLRAYGFRELLGGAGILKSERSAFWLWSRVGGDAVDPATLAALYREAAPADRTRLLASAGAVLGVAALDVLCAIEHTRAECG